MKEKIKQPHYKRHQVMDLYCPNCQTFMSGNGSDYFPYNCKCGIWKRDFETGDYIFKEHNVQ